MATVPTIPGELWQEPMVGHGFGKKKMVDGRWFLILVALPKIPRVSYGSAEYASHLRTQIISQTGCSASCSGVVSIRPGRSLTADSENEMAL
jgi:hypothetical protein